ncbi:MAG: MTH938/NDUFAF3 family protein [Gammaproteobacteria bacterium]|nr:MTH938/NDUFAF3 family protein [Gammaproteobacteria bacterium]
MVLTQDNSNATYQIQSITAHNIKINNEIYTHSLIVSPEKLMPNWKPQSIEAITDEDLLLFLDFKPDIILLGTGINRVIPRAKKLACLLEKQFHIECMNTAAACRTYTVLISEGRKVTAGLII